MNNNIFAANFNDHRARALAGLAFMPSFNAVTWKSNMMSFPQYRWTPLGDSVAPRQERVRSMPLVWEMIPPLTPLEIFLFLPWHPSPFILQIQQSRSRQMVLKFIQTHTSCKLPLHAAFAENGTINDAVSRKIEFT